MGFVEPLLSSRVFKDCRIRNTDSVVGKELHIVADQVRKFCGLLLTVPHSLKRAQLYGLGKCRTYFEPILPRGTDTDGPFIF